MSNNNSMNATQGTWIATDNGSVEQNSDNGRLTIASAKQGSPVSVHWQPNPTNSGSSSTTTTTTTTTSYLQVTVHDLPQRGGSSVSVGIAQPHAVHGGYKTLGMFYNGNLTNGRAALQTSFGPRLATGDVVGLLWQEEVQPQANSNTIKVWVYVNEACLGCAFDVTTAPNPTKERYWPCLNVTGTVTLTCDFPPQVPSARTRFTPTRQEGSMVGEWQLHQAMYGPELGAFALPDQVQIVAKVHPSTNSETDNHHQYAVSIKVANTMNTTMTLAPTQEPNGWHKIVSISPIMSTMMMPPPPLQAVESPLLSQGLPGLTQVRVDGSRMLWQGPTVELAWEPHVPTFPTLTSYT